MKVKTYIYVSQELLEVIDAGARQSQRNRSDFIETAVRIFIQQLERREQNAKDLEIINRRADYLNREAKGYGSGVGGKIDKNISTCLRFDRSGCSHIGKGESQENMVPVIVQHPQVVCIVQVAHHDGEMCSVFFLYLLQREFVGDEFFDAPGN
jgi:hypothetical protein